MTEAILPVLVTPRSGSNAVHPSDPDNSNASSRNARLVPSRSALAQHGPPRGVGDIRQEGREAVVPERRPGDCLSQLPPRAAQAGSAASRAFWVASLGSQRPAKSNPEIAPAHTARGAIRVRQRILLAATACS